MNSQQNGSRAVAQRPAYQPQQRAGSTVSEQVLSRYGYSPEQAEVIRKQIGAGMNDAQILFGLEVAKARGLDLFKREVYIFEAKGRVCVVPSIEGLRAICERSHLIDGPIDIQYCGPDGQWTDAWLADAPPSAARATGYRKDSSRPYRFVALWKEFHRALDTWTTYPAHMLGTVAERHLRKRMIPEAVTDLDLDEDPAEALETSARNYLWAVANDHGWSHDQVHELVFGISPKASLTEEIQRRGMDWRDAAQLVVKAIEHSAERVALPERAVTARDVDLLYEGRQADPLERTVKHEGQSHGSDYSASDEAQKSEPAAHAAAAEAPPAPPPVLSAAEDAVPAAPAAAADILPDVEPDTKADIDPDIDPDAGADAPSARSADSADVADGDEERCGVCGAPGVAFIVTEVGAMSVCKTHQASDDAAPAGPALLPLPAGVTNGGAFMTAAREQLDLDFAEVNRRLHAPKWSGNLPAEEYAARWAQIQRQPTLGGVS